MERGVVVSVLLVLFICGNCNALSQKMTETELIRGSDEIIYGAVTDVRSQWTPDQRNIETTASITVLENLKGTDPAALSGNAVPVTILGGTVGDTTQWVEDSPVLVPDTQAVVFLKKSPSGRYTIFGSEMGVYPITSSPAYTAARESGTAFQDSGTKEAAIARSSGDIKDVAYFREKINAATDTAGSSTSTVSPGTLLPASAVLSSRGGPVIRGISVTTVNPATASAGTTTLVTITGSGFGTKASRASLGDVAFLYRTDGAYPYIWATGYPNYLENDNDIVSWSDTTIQVRVPTGITEDGYSGSASSGFLFVLTDAGATSSWMPFTVSFGYGKKKWSAPLTYYVNPGSVAGSDTAIQNAGSTWKNAIPGSAFNLNYGGISGSTTFGHDGTNLIYFGPSSDFPDPNIIAWATQWSTGGYVTEADIEFNTRWTWTTGSASGDSMNVEAIVLHEMGHWLTLRDLYGYLPEAGYPGYPSDISPEKKVMFGYNGDFFGNKNLKTLSAADTAGIQWIYPSSSPAISSISPTSGYRNNTVNFTIRGSGFLNGATVALKLAGYSDIPCSVIEMTSTTITGYADLPAQVQTGAYTVNVTNPGNKSGAKASAFTVKSISAPVVTSVTPATANRNTTVAFTITGNYFQQGAVLNLTRAGYGNITATVNTLTATQITGSFDIPADAPAGRWNANVTTKDGGEKGQIGGYTITAMPVPSVLSITPLSGYRNATVPVTVSGRNFQQGAVLNLTRAGYGNVTATVNTLTDTRITGSFDIPADVPTGTWNVNVTTNDGGERGRINGFAVYGFPAPAVTAVAPASGYRNATTTFAVTGTNFEQGAVLNLTRAGYGNITVTVNTLTATQITGSFDIPADAPAGSWNVNVTTKDGGERGKLNGFIVLNYPAPLVLAITPSGGYRNNTIAFTVNGSYYQQGEVLNLTRAGYGNITATIDSLSGTQITGSFALPAGVPAGAWNVNVTTKDGGESGKLNGFTMNAYPAPAVSGITPSKGYRNDTVSFKITGTSFQQGAVVNLTRYGYGNITAALSAITATQILGTFEIPTDAPTGTWNVNVTTKDGGERGRINGFTVTNCPAPVVSSLMPILGYRNNTVPFTLYGNYYLAGTVVNLSRPEYGNITATLSAITATQITGTFDIPADAPTNTWNLDVTTKNGGKMTRPDLFTVNDYPAHTISRITPATGVQDSTVPFTVNGRYFQPGSVVNLSRPAYGNITAALSSITTTQIKGQFVIPAGATPGLWNLNVTTKDGGDKSRANAFTITAKVMGAPTTMAVARATPATMEITPEETIAPVPEITTGAMPGYTGTPETTPEPAVVPVPEVTTVSETPVPSETITEMPTGSTAETTLPATVNPEMTPEPEVTIDSGSPATFFNETVNGTAGI